MTTSADSMAEQILDVPGARLCYEVRGSGPVLLLIPGGPADAGVFARIVPLLTAGYTVVTYDPRGLSRSTIDGPEREIPVEVQAGDAHLLLSAVTQKPAYVFGNSGGAITGLALVTRYPDQVRTLIAHEPPVIELLPDYESVVAENEQLYETYLKDGFGPAMQKFLAMAGLEGRAGPPPSEPQETPDPEMQAAMARMQRNLDLFFGHMLREITAYRPDTAALQAASSQVIVACGTTSDGQLAHRTAVALADQLHTAPVEFPGDHGGFAGETEAFAQALHRVLGGATE